MKCLKCPKKAVISYPNGDLCSSCFIEILVNRIKKQTKKENPFVKNERILVVGKLARVFLNKAIEMPLKIDVIPKIIDRIPYDKYDKIVIPWTADDEAELFYEEITKTKPNFRENKKIVKLFKTILDEELIKAAKIMKINFKLPKRNKELEKIHKKFSSAKFGLVKSSEEFRKATR